MRSAAARTWAPPGRPGLRRCCGPGKRRRPACTSRPRLMSCDWRHKPGSTVPEPGVTSDVVELGQMETHRQSVAEVRKRCPHHQHARPVPLATGALEPGHFDAVDSRSSAISSSTRSIRPWSQISVVMRRISSRESSLDSDTATSWLKSAQIARSRTTAAQILDPAPSRQTDPERAHGVAPIIIQGFLWVSALATVTVPASSSRRRDPAGRPSGEQVVPQRRLSETLQGGTVDVGWSCADRLWRGGLDFHDGDVRA